MTITTSDLMHRVTAEQHDPARYLIERGGDVMEALECGDLEAARLIHGGPAGGPKNLTLEDLNDYQALSRQVSPFTSVTVNVDDSGDLEQVAAHLSSAPKLQHAEEDFDSDHGRVLASVRTEHTRTYPDGRVRALTDVERCWQATQIVQQTLGTLPTPDAPPVVAPIGLQRLGRASSAAFVDRSRENLG
jgi:hypothetical protein